MSISGTRDGSEVALVGGENIETIISLRENDVRGVGDAEAGKVFVMCD